MDLELWLTRLAALPCCHSLMLSGSHVSSDMVRGCLGGFPVLRRLWCDDEDMVFVILIRLGLSPFEWADGPMEEVEWLLATAALAMPDIRFPPCALMTLPRLDARPSSMSGIGSLML